VDSDVFETLNGSIVMSAEPSPDSVNPESNDRFRDPNGAFEETLEVLEICSEARILTPVASTVTDLNFENQDAIFLSSR